MIFSVAVTLVVFWLGDIESPRSEAVALVVSLAATAVVLGGTAINLDLDATVSIAASFAVACWISWLVVGSFVSRLFVALLRESSGHNDDDGQNGELDSRKQIRYQSRR